MSAKDVYDVIVLGAGLAGLTLADALSCRGLGVVVIEAETAPGGLCRTIQHDAFRFDLGGHRFFTSHDQVHRWFTTLMRDRILEVRRSSSVISRLGTYEYPLVLGRALRELGLRNGVAAFTSYIAGLSGRQRRSVHSFEEWGCQQFGRFLYDAFFRDYTAKVWGCPAAELSAEWAARRIGIRGLTYTVRRALIPSRALPATLARKFLYCPLGIGEVIDALLARTRKTGRMDLLLGTRPKTVIQENRRFRVETTGKIRDAVVANRLVSTIPLPQLLHLGPHFNPSKEVREALCQCQYRGVICVFLGLSRSSVRREHWLYFPDPETPFGRIHEPPNWSSALAPSGCTSLVAELFATPGDAVWSKEDSTLIRDVTTDLSSRGWIRQEERICARVVRVPYAYPVQTVRYASAVPVLNNFLAEQAPELCVLGRTGSYRYLNMDGVIADALDLADQTAYGG